MNVSQAVHEFISNLELTEKESDDASRQHTNLRDGLTQKLDLNPDYNTFLTGSYARKTAIRPLKDIDVFCVLQRTDKRNEATLTPTLALSAIKETLEELYPGKVAAPQRRSVNIEFTGTGIAYDVVPAFIDEVAMNNDEEVFFIPDVDQSKWIRSNPRVHKQKSTDANEQAGKDLKPLTKAIKHWNRRQAENAQLRSFHLEVMAWEVMKQKPENRLEGLKDLFLGLATRVLTSTPDPAGLGPAIDDGLTWNDRIAAKTRFEEAASVMSEAMRLAKDGKTDAAHHKLYSLFGEPYPEKGKAEPTAKPNPITALASVSVPSAPDASKSRFG